MHSLLPHSRAVDGRSAKKMFSLECLYLKKKKKKKKMISFPFLKRYIFYYTHMKVENKNAQEQSLMVG